MFWMKMQNHARILQPDLLPTFWRIAGTQQVVVSLWRRWTHGNPSVAQMLSLEQVEERIKVPTRPWMREPSNDVWFANGADLIANGNLRVCEDVGSISNSMFMFVGAITMDFPNGFRPRENWHVNVTHTGFLSHGIERFLDTMNSKMSRRHVSSVHGRQQLVMFAARFGADTIDDPDVYKLFCVGPLGCVSNMDVGQLHPPQNYDEASRTLLPTLSLEGANLISPNASINLVVNVIDPSTLQPYPQVPRAIEIHLEATAGYLPRRRVTAENGQAVFDVHALHLQAGDAIKVKAGFWNFTGAAEHIIKVV